MLEVKNASVTLGGKQLFAGLSFLAPEGQVVCIMGESGAGKTTLLRAMLGFLPLDEGFITVDGEVLTALSAEYFRRQISYVPQELSLPSETVSEMVSLPFLLRQNKGIAFSKDLLMAEWQRLGLPPSLYDKHVSEVSGGERQRMMIAVSGLLGKRILMVDEPTSALDAATARLVLDYFRDYASKGRTVIAVSHDREFAGGCHQIIQL